MKIAVFGGSFNPLHIGHATVAETLVKEYGYDKVLFVPTFIAPHKEIAGCISAEHRLGMIKAFCAADGNGAFEAEDCEIKRGGVSYTCDTLEYLKTKFEKVLDGKFALVMGEEIASEFYKWKNPDKISSLADFIINSLSIGFIEYISQILTSKPCFSNISAAFKTSSKTSPQEKIVISFPSPI